MPTNVSLKNAASKARLRLTGLSRMYRIIANATSHAQVSISPARPTRNSVSDPRMLLAVAAGGRGTKRGFPAKNPPQRAAKMMEKERTPPARAGVFGGGFGGRLFIFFGFLLPKVFLRVRAP